MNSISILHFDSFSAQLKTLNALQTTLVIELPCSFVVCYSFFVKDHAHDFTDREAQESSRQAD